MCCQKIFVPAQDISALNASTLQKKRVFAAISLAERFHQWLANPDPNRLSMEQSHYVAARSRRASVRYARWRRSCPLCRPDRHSLPMWISQTRLYGIPQRTFLTAYHHHLRNSRLHYHKRLTETYLILECEPGALLELNECQLPLSPEMAILIPPGTRHRAIGKMKVAIVAWPKFDPSDECSIEESAEGRGQSAVGRGQCRGRSKQ